MTSRKAVEKVLLSVWQGEGRGARVRRSIGRPELKNLDPFLMLDEFAGNANDGAGFPDHPHRGFETVSYLLEGEFIHEDFMGHRGRMTSGAVQWMTAGRGVVHSEMPGPVDTRGLQLWVNLKKEFKMIKPNYQEKNPEDVPSTKQNGVFVKVIAGESMGVKSEIRTLTPTSYLDFTVDPGAQFEQPITEGWTTFAYTLEGTLKFGRDDKLIGPHNTVVFSRDGATVNFKNEDSKVARFVLISGQPIGEPVAQRGPFVMNTQQELAQAVQDYQLQRNGFENAHTWSSVEGNKG